MELKKLKQEELETMGYDDIAYLIFKESNKKMKIQPLFKKVCKILDLPDSVFETQIADFFELISTDKRFIMVDGYFDLRDYHSHKVKIENDEAEMILDSIDDIDYDEENEDEIDIDAYEGDERDDIPDNDLKDLVIISEDGIDSDERL